MKIFHLLWLPAWAAAQSLILIGGEFQANNSDVWNRMIELAGGKEKARIGVMTTGTADAINVGNLNVDILVNTYGANATYIDVRPDNDMANDPDTAELARSMTGFFFTGGIKQLIVYTLINDGEDTLVMRAIRQVLREGGMFAGTSASFACQGGSVMLINGDTWDGFVNGAVANSGPVNQFPDRLTYDAGGGLGFFFGYVLDAHFSERGREGRLIRVTQQTRDIAITGATRGLAIDEDTALVITDLYTKPIGTVVGSGWNEGGGVTYIDVHNTISHPSNTTDYENISYSFLTLDDTIDLTTGEINFASWKSDLQGAETLETAEPSDDIFSNRLTYQWRQTAADLMNSRTTQVLHNYSDGKDPEFEVIFDRRWAARSGGRRPGGSDAFFTSYSNMTVHIRPSDRQILF